VILVHVAGTFYLAGMVLRDMLAPQHDPVRADGTDDPGGGLVDGAPDAFVLPAPGAAAPAPRQTVDAHAP
jgi:hypothetical protein